VQEGSRFGRFGSWHAGIRSRLVHPRADFVKALLILFEAYRLALRALVLVMSAHFVTGTLTYLRRRTPPAPQRPAQWPRVTVQLPIRNEFYTAARVIEAAAALDYPREELEIQVLDDSDDQTVGVVTDVVNRLRATGVDIVVVRRAAPTGFKAGALAFGLGQGQGQGNAKGEFVAVFDADFVPPPDFLMKTIPYFGDPAVGLVQGRWEHRNRNESWFTALQARVLDGLMVVEQTAKSSAGVPMQFNGTGGVWRRRAIEQSGGWTFDSLTEDFDLSLRAVIAGWRLIHLPDVAVPSDLPTTLGLFRVQQRRWALGTAQLLRKRLRTVLSANLSVSARAALSFQLLRHFGYPLLCVMVMTVPLTTFAYVRTPFEYGAINAVVLAIAISSVAFQHAVAQRALGRGVAGAILLAPLSVALAVGLAPTYTVALWYGLRDRAGAFHRTPKVPRAPGPGEPQYRAVRSVLVVLEIGIGAAYLFFTTVAVLRGLFPEATFLAFVAGSYLWVGFGSLHVNAAPGAASHAMRPEGAKMPSSALPKA
jgi:cellulose synthase/poly-beta-1,6-N-acetylglucosamine synthase-like glycosyltransferase